MAIRIGHIAFSVLVAAASRIGSAFPAPTTRRYLYHDWVSEASLESSWATDVSDSHSTVAEERRALLDRPARVQGVRFTGMSRDESMYALMALSRAGAERTLVPVYSSLSYLTAAVSGAVVPCDTRWRRFHVGGYVLLHNPGTDLTEVGVVLSLTDSQIALTGSVSGTFDTTRCRVYPLMVSELAISNRIDAVTDAHCGVVAEFREVMDDTALPGLNYGPPPALSLAGYPVFRTEPDWNNAVSVTVLQQGSVADLGNGTVYTVRGSRPKYRFDFNLTHLERDEAWDTLRFFDAMKGRLSPFLVVNPMVLFSPFEILASRIDVYRFTEDTGGDTDIAEFLEYVAVEQYDGTLEIVPVSGVAATTNGGTDVYRISLGTNLSGAVSLSDAKKVTSAHLVRFANDAIRESWVTDEVCQIEFSALEVLQEVSKAITGLEDTPGTYGVESVGSGPFAWFVPAKNSYSPSNELSVDGDELAYVFDAREVPPSTGLVSAARPWLENDGLSGSDIVRETLADLLTGRGRPLAAFAAGASDKFLLSALTSVNISDTWFDNTDGVTIFVAVTDLAATARFFYQAGVLEWDYTDCKMFETLSGGDPSYNVAYADQEVLDNEVAIFVLRWDPGVSLEVWRDGVSLGTASAPIASLPTGGGDIEISGDEFKFFDWILYKEALSDSDLNTVAGLLSSNLNGSWVDI